MPAAAPLGLAALAPPGILGMDVSMPHPPPNARLAPPHPVLTVPACLADAYLPTVGAGDTAGGGELLSPTSAFTSAGGWLRERLSLDDRRPERVRSIDAPENYKTTAMLVRQVRGAWLGAWGWVGEGAGSG